METIITDEQNIADRLLSLLRNNDRITIEITKNGKKDIIITQNITEYFKTK